MKKTGLLFFILSIAVVASAQGPKCSCPPMQMYVYDTKIDFPIDSNSNAAEGGKYVEVQNSGDWLEAAYTKQQSDEFEVYKGLMPGASTGTTYQQPPSNGSGPGGDIDFTSYAEVSRSGDPGAYTYTVTVRITDAHNGSAVATLSQSDSDLGHVDDMIDAMVGSFSPVPDKLRDYQKKLRDQSGGTKWIGAKWKATADKSDLKIDETTNVLIKVFDCADEKPIPNQHIKLELTDDNVGKLSKTEVTTNSSGEATVVFTAKDNGETRIVPDFTFTDIKDKTRNGTSCSDQGNIDVANSLYQLTADFEASGPEGISYKFQGKSKVYLKHLPDGTYMLAPLDKSRFMDLTIETAQLTDHSTFIGPKAYKIPFLFTMDKLNNQHTAHATFALTTVCPMKGQVKWIFHADGHDVLYTVDIDKGTVTYQPGNTVSLPNGAGQPYAFNGASDLDILQYFGQTQVMNDFSENMSNGQDIIAFARRMQAHEHDPNYFKTAQGKADLKQMQTLQKKMGYNGAMPQNMGQAALLKAANQYNPAPNSQAPKMMPGMARVRVEDTFNSEDGTAFNGTLQGGVGPMQASIKVKVEKLK
ncbi:MAG TPA: hypothetical protein VHC47_02935 [Mucilaginibacter sp.]|nr:hypothetical protein [Mucilaginibacter sp.]